MKKYVTLMIVSLVLGASAHAEKGPQKPGDKIDCKNLVAHDAAGKTAPGSHVDDKDVPASAQDAK